MDIVNLKCLISKSNVSIFEFEVKFLIPQLKLSLQGIPNTEYCRGIRLISRSAEDGDIMPDPEGRQNKNLISDFANL